MHRELFEDDENISAASNRNAVLPYSISLNLVQRKFTDTDVNKISSMANANDKRNNATDKFNDSVMSTDRRKAIAKVGSNSNSSQSFVQLLKSAFRCNTSLNKIIEQTQLNYPLNLHLRMNEIFSMHDKLCDIAESFNDLYSIGEDFFLYFFFVI